jgi:histidine phosphotransfer protein HptB
MMTSSIIDLNTFSALKETMGADFIGELVQAYFDETPKLLAELQQALDKLDCESFRRAAHSIKSTSNSFGALTFGDHARALEMQGKEARLDGADVKVKSLAAEYAAVQQALEDLCHD